MGGGSSLVVVFILTRPAWGPAHYSVRGFIVLTLVTPLQRRAALMLPLTNVPSDKQREYKHTSAAERVLLIC